MFLLFCFIASSIGYMYPYAIDNRCQNYNLTDRDLLLGCLSQLIDTNHDDILNATEVNAFNNVCCSTWPDTMMNANDYFEMTCDINHDGKLDMWDWNHRHACCKNSMCMTYLCSFCYRHGWTGPPPPSKK